MNLVVFGLLLSLAAFIGGRLIAVADAQAKEHAKAQLHHLALFEMAHGRMASPSSYELGDRLARRKPRLAYALMSLGGVGLLFAVPQSLAYVVNSIAHLG